MLHSCKQINKMNISVILIRTAVGIVCKDGVVLAVEKIVTSKLYEPGVNKRIFIIDQHIGMVKKEEILKIP